MPQPKGPKSPPPPEHPHAPLAGFLSYLIPGLGQIYQGRIGKGLLFLVAVYSLFFYGMALGQWKNVYLVNEDQIREKVTLNLLVVQFELEGVAKSLYQRPQYLCQFWVGAAAWPAILQYRWHDPNADQAPPLGGFQRQPNEEELNRLQTEGDKSWDLAWVYTVIAGVLNVLVIYDAYAGPAFVVEQEKQPEGEAAAA